MSTPTKTLRLTILEADVLYDVLNQWIGSRIIIDSTGQKHVSAMQRVKKKLRFSFNGRPAHPRRPDGSETLKMNHPKSTRGDVNVALLSVLIVIALILLISGGLWGCPNYAVYQQRLEGEAELAKANYSKQVAVQEANARKDSASLLADAEIARARGVAEANKIIGSSLKGNEAYLRYLWIMSLESNNAKVIYVPTEANLPILEASRLKEPEQP